jgi:SAM-dependent methyltransferase
LKVLPSACTDLDLTWYEMIRDELLRRIIPEGARVLDVGCGAGEVLRTLSGRIQEGVGVDISEERVTRARNEARETGLANVEFGRASVLELPFASGACDVVVCLGDVLSSSTVFGKQSQAVAEMKRVLAEGGLTVYEGMNWEWEYAGSPQWTFFSRTGRGDFRLHRVNRTPSGRETSRSYDVVRPSELHEWIRDQEWPTSPSGHRVSLDVVEEEAIPQRFLRRRGTDRYQFYTTRSLEAMYTEAGFRGVEVFAYGQTYEIVSRAGLVDEFRPAMEELARAEAELILEQRAGGGPWLFLVGRK